MLIRKHSWRRAAAPLGLLLLSGAALTVTAAAPATAAAVCAGSEIESKTARTSSGKIIAELIVYYSSSTKKNCAVMYNRTGETREVSVSIDLCRSGTGDGTEFCDMYGGSTDSGNYRYYAGPVYTPPASGICIYAQGWIENGSSGKFLTIDGHCE